MILKGFIGLCRYGRLKKMTTIFCSSSHQETESIFLPFDSELDLAYFGHRDISKHEYKQRFENDLHLWGLLSLDAFGN